MRLLASICLLLGFSVAASAAEVPCTDCDVYQNGISRKVVPTRDIICIYFIQPESDRIVLRLDLTDGAERRYEKEAGKTGRICIGRQWLYKTKKMLVCNGRARAVYEPEHVEQIKKKATLSREGEACLYGRAECKEKGYMTRD